MNENNFLRHPLTIAITTALLTALLGQWVAHQYQMRSFNYQRHLEYIKDQYSDGMDLMAELSKSMGNRLFGMQRVYWILKKSKLSNEDIDSVWKEHYHNVTIWNENLLSYKTRLRQYLGESFAQKFINDSDSNISNVNTDQFESVHGYFYVVHEHLLQLKNCIHDGCDGKSREFQIERLTKEIDGLGKFIENFVGECTEELRKKLEGAPL